MQKSHWFSAPNFCTSLERKVVNAQDKLEKEMERRNYSEREKNLIRLSLEYSIEMVALVVAEIERTRNEEAVQ